MSLLPVDRWKSMPRDGLMRDESDQVPNFTDHLDTISRDLIFGRPNLVTLRLVCEYDVNNSQCQFH